MADPVINTNFNPSYLNTLASSFNSSPTPQRSLIVPAMVELKEVSTGNTKTLELKDPPSTNWPYISGIVATLGQAIAGLVMIPAAFIERGENSSTKTKKAKLPVMEKKDYKKEKQKIIDKFGESSVEKWAQKWKTEGKFPKIVSYIEKNNAGLHGKGKLLSRIGWWSMGISYLVSMPSCLNASLKAQQPSMFFGMSIWGISSLFMPWDRFRNSARLIATTPLGATFIYSGMANKVKNENELKPGEKPRVFNFKDINSKNYLSKTAEFFKFIGKDLSTAPRAAWKAYIQTANYITGSRKEPPEFWTIKPTENNSKLASFLLFPGSLLLLAYGKKHRPGKAHTKIEKLANILIGTGLLSEALYMFTLGNSQRGKDKAIILSGVPLRAVGDFAQTNPAMLGMRTLGGASFEYYFATLNKRKKQKAEQQNNTENLN